jgi:tRNA-splicing ligase RtcB
MDMRPGLPLEIKHLAWLEEDSQPGRGYWAAMELMGRYAAANHELIHRNILAALGTEALATVENHHNFAWRENHEGQEVIVHRKGATPADQGRLGLIPGSMGAPGFVVRGRGCPEALLSCSHGAGRRLSRSAALKTLGQAEVTAYLAEREVELISGGLDEAPMAYKDIEAVMAAQADLVDIVARFEPRLVKMAPAKIRRPKKDSNISTAVDGQAK